MHADTPRDIHAQHRHVPSSDAVAPDEARPLASHAAHGAHDGHDKHAGHSVEMFRRKLWGTLLLSVPTVVWSPMIQHWFGYTAPGGAVAARWIPAVFGVLVFAYGGWVFVKGAAGEL